MIELLIKMADSLDKRGLHKEATKVDTLIKKIAVSLEVDASENELEKIAKKKKSKGKKKDADKDGDIDSEDYLMVRNQAIEKAIKERRKKAKGKKTKGKKEKEEDIDKAYDRILKKRVKNFRG